MGVVVGAGVEGLAEARGSEVSVGVVRSTRRAQEPESSNAAKAKAAKQRIGLVWKKGGKCSNGPPDAAGPLP
ncbi:hypothetical protein GCM10027048_08110 [Hymenobacter coalescens]